MTSEFVPRDADIRVIKLASSEEIICQIESEEDSKIVITDPFMIQPSLDPSSGSYFILPWLIGSDLGQTVELERTGVICIVDAAEEFLGGYIGALEKWHLRILAKSLGDTMPEEAELLEDEEDLWEDDDPVEDAPPTKTFH